MAEKQVQITIAGKSMSGKTTVGRMLAKALDDAGIEVTWQDGTEQSLAVPTKSPGEEEWFDPSYSQVSIETKEA